jgi:tetratricopeptide (TPR) repeat protein
MTTTRKTPTPAAELDGLFALAQLEASAGRLAKAAEIYQQILALAPESAEANNYLGNVLLMQGKLDEAVARYERALALQPDLVEPHNNLGIILRAQGKLDRAVAQLEQALVLRPDFVEAHNNLGNVLKEQGKLDDAAAQYEHALALRPNLIEAHYNLGTILRAQGKLDEAVSRFERALALRPNYAEALRSLAKVFKEQGKFDQASARYEQMLSLQPDFAEAHYERTDLKTFQAGDADLAALEALAADTDHLPPRKKVYVHFALGKALEDAGDYQRAFEHLLLGNALKRREVHYDEAAFHKYLRLIAEVFDSRLLDRFQGMGDPSSAPIFVLGMPRSGSTLVEQILASHPQVHAAGELWDLDRIATAISDTGGRPVPFPQSIRTLSSDNLRQLGQAYLASLPPLAEGRQRITDKMPKNFVYIGLIRLILPNARIIHTRRDPVDTCISCFSRLFTTGLTYSYDLAELGRYYCRYHDLMAHWRSVLSAGAMLDVSYERVVDNIEEHARRLIEYCGLPWDDRCLSFHETKRQIATPSNVQVRRPLYRSSLARWRRYEAYLAPLLTELEGYRQQE